MAKTARCKDTGRNCEFVIQGATDEELLTNAALHGRDAHRIGEQGEEITSTFGSDFISSMPGLEATVVGEQGRWLQRVKGAIREE